MRDPVRMVRRGCKKEATGMARQNRVSVCDGIYHVTARIAHRAMLFRDAAVKDKVVEILLGAADFSGVELYAWCVMDNHLHLLVHVPRVPERYWLKPGEEPAAYAFGTRPPACRVPLWHPEGDSPCSASPEGDSPLDTRSRPPLGFALPDDEMIARLASLYGAAKAKRIEREWAELRKRGLGATVDDEKSRQCRRMYNLSQYVKTVKERISTWYNETRGHEGCLWQGRFHSGVVERVPDVLTVKGGTAKVRAASIACTTNAVFKFVIPKRGFDSVAVETTGTIALDASTPIEIDASECRTAEWQTLLAGEEITNLSLDQVSVSVAEGRKGDLRLVKNDGEKVTALQFRLKGAGLMLLFK